MELSNQEIARYSRQIILPGVGVGGQKKLKSCAVLVVGAGGLGCSVCQNLGGAGVGRIGIVDYDDIEITNLHRQFLHREDGIGESKVESIAKFLKALNSDIEVVTYKVIFNSTNAAEIVSQYDIVVDASDNVATRYLLNDLSVLSKKPLVSGSALKFEGQMTVYNYQNGPCFRCIFPQPPPPETVQNCGDGGVLGTITSVIGSLQSMEVIKIILQHDDVCSGKLLLYDGAACSFRSIKLRQRNKDCNVCGDNPTITELIDYEQFCGMAATDKDSGLSLLESSERISVDEYSKMDKSNIVLIDVRSANEFEICRLEGSVNVPIKTLLSNNFNEDLKQQMSDRTVFVVCRRGNDSQLAVRHLADKLGIQSKDLSGGLHAWTRNVDNNFPIY